MKHAFFFILIFITGLLIASCSASRDLPKKALFSFEYESENYQIVSITDPSGEGMNLLLKVDNDSSLFRTLDQDQDGIIDIIQYGSVTLEEANLIYTFGIKEANNNGKLRGRDRVRIFNYKEEPNRYTIQTYGLYRDALYNRFTILNIHDNTEEIFLDVNADGILDRIEISDRNLPEVQSIYKRILNEGIKQQRIHIRFEKFIVKTQPQNLPS